MERIGGELFSFRCYYCFFFNLFGFLSQNIFVRLFSFFDLQVTHSLTVVFFSRTFLSGAQTSVLDCKDIYGRSYEVCILKMHNN